MRLPAVRVVALVLPLACSGNGPGQLTGTGGIGGIGGAGGDDRLFVPEGLPNTQWEGEVGVTLKLVASTLVQGPTGSPAYYAAVKNDGANPACNAGILTDFIDKTGQTVAQVGTALLSKQLYRFDADEVLACIDPGQIAMTVATNLPAELVIGDLVSLKHTFPTFGVDGIVPLGGLTVSQVQTVGKGAASAYTGTLTNPLDVTARNPSVTIFPVNRVGRPLGAATSSATIDVPPGGSWSFETTTVTDVGVDYAGYPAADVN